MDILTIILLIALAIAVVVGLLLAYVFYLQHKRESYFKEKGIPFSGGVLGQLLKVGTGSMSLVEWEEILYQNLIKTKAPIMGLSDLVGGSNVFISDPEILRSILVKDFSHFVNRRELKTQQSSKYFKKMMFAAQNEQWKGVRGKLSPTFTTGRIRRMFHIFKSSSDKMDGYLKDNMEYPGRTRLEVDFAQILSKYAMDVIASCAFGIDSKAWEQEGESRFEMMGRKFGFHMTIKVLLKFIVITIMPKIADLLDIDALDGESQGYFAAVVREAMKRRRESGHRREDFLQLMLDAQQDILKADEETAQVMNGSGDGSGINLDANEKQVSFDDDAIVANAMLFLLGGFDTTQSVLLFTLYNLALEEDVQEKLHEEVTSVLEKHQGQVSYESMMEMTYLDMVIHESMRLYPPATRMERACNKNYPVPGTDMVIEKDTVVIVPVLGIHRDPKNYPDPEKFIPERFTSENKATRNPYVYLPFGMGPRNCIGMRFALVEVKAVLIQLIQSYTITPSAKTKIPVEFGTNATLKPKHGMWLNISARE